jgi:hypothetical protein|tara:strand:- start:897 stop:1121 length:225 start_codon:yes stop_codon:yes gene_type:complete
MSRDNQEQGISLKEAVGYAFIPGRLSDKFGDAVFLWTGDYLAGKMAYMAALTPPMILDGLILYGGINGLINLVS